MNKPITILIVAFCCLTSNVAWSTETDSSKIHFENALQEVKEMLEETKALDFQRAVFITENAYHDNAYSYEAFQQTIANNLYLITQLINANNKSDTIDFNVKVKQNGRFNIDEIRYTPEQKKELYNKVLTNWAIFTYITDTTTFGNYIHYPYQYNAKDPFGMKDWKNAQVINLLSSNENKGNCFAFAALFKIFANQLNSDAVICTAPQHIYIQHKDHKGDWYNVELATAGHPTDGSIQTLTYTTNKALMNDIALRNLDEKQSVALCLVNLAKSYEHKYNNPTADFLLQCAELALQHDPKNLNALLLKQQVLDARVVMYARANKINTIEKLRNDKKINGQFTQLEKHLTHLSQLGYIQMPLDMQEIVLNGFKGEHAAQFIKKDKNPSPFTSIDVPDEQNQYVDVSHGLFQEVFAPKAIEIYGHFTFNTQQGKLTQLDTSTINHQLIDPVAFAYNFGARMYDARLGRFLSIDPLAHNYPSISPYTFSLNNPIYFIDETGGLVTDSEGNPVYINIGKPISGDAQADGTFEKFQIRAYFANDGSKIYVRQSLGIYTKSTKAGFDENGQTQIIEYDKKIKDKPDEQRYWCHSWTILVSRDSKNDNLKSDLPSEFFINEYDKETGETRRIFTKTDNVPQLFTEGGEYKLIEGGIEQAKDLAKSKKVVVTFQVSEEGGFNHSGILNPDGTISAKNDRAVQGDFTIESQNQYGKIVKFYEFLGDKKIDIKTNEGKAKSEKQVLKALKKSKTSN